MKDRLFGICSKGILVEMGHQFPAGAVGKEMELGKGNILVVYVKTQDGEKK